MPAVKLWCVEVYAKIFSTTEIIEGIQVAVVRVKFCSFGVCDFYSSFFTFRLNIIFLAPKLYQLNLLMIIFKR